MTDKKKTTTAQQAKEKIYRYCAYQERSHKEVRDKLYSYGLHSYEVEELITHLITEGFVNEERFAKAFAGGKFRMKGWGRIKIQHALEARGISSYCIKSGLKEIPDDDYVDALQELLDKRMRLADATNIFLKRNKLATYAIQRGFEPELVWRQVKALLPDK